MWFFYHYYFLKIYYFFGHKFQDKKFKTLQKLRYQLEIFNHCGSFLFVFRSLGPLDARLFLSLKASEDMASTTSCFFL